MWAFQNKIVAQSTFFSERNVKIERSFLYLLDWEGVKGIEKFPAGAFLHGK